MPRDIFQATLSGNKRCHGSLESREADQRKRSRNEEIRSLEESLGFEEYISTKKLKDPFKDMDSLKQKVEIKQDVNYQGTSFGEIFEKYARNSCCRKRRAKKLHAVGRDGPMGAI